MLAYASVSNVASSLVKNEETNDFIARSGSFKNSLIQNKRQKRSIGPLTKTDLLLSKRDLSNVYTMWI